MTTGKPQSEVRVTWFLLPAILVTLADVAATLWFQPQSYWLGHYSSAVENNPVGSFFLRLHPLAFVGFMVAWISLVVFLGIRLRPPWSTVAVLTVLLGHTAGAFGLLKRLGFMPALSVFLLVALITTFCWRRSGTFIQT